MLKNYVLAFLFFALVEPIFAQKNVILLIADDLGTDYLGFYDDGLDTAKMPNIRSLLKNGVRFTKAWSYPVCSEIRAAVLTGRYPFRTGVGTVITSAANGQLDTAEISIGKLLKNAAAPTKYATANVGKWHLHTSMPANRNFPAALGYDHYSGNFIGQVNDYFNWQKIVDGAAPVTVTNYATTEQTDDAIKWLSKLDGSKPFFLWQAFNAPHFPFHLPPAALHSVPNLTGTAADLMAHRPEYFKAMIEAMDTEIGRLFKWLDDHNLRDNTNIIFIGDNGDDSRICQFPNPQRAKGTVYEAGVHVPMIISGPAVASPGRKSDALVSTTDLFATIVEMAGFSAWKNLIPTTKPVDAVSLLPILKNEKTAVRDWVFTEVFDPAGTPDDGKAIRDLDFKLFRFDDGHEEFYKIATDPNEATNLLLQLPLDANARAHYIFLCSALTGLVGTAACLPSVGTENLGENTGFSISPNPVSDFLDVHFSENARPASGEILDAAGQRVLLFTDVKKEKLDVSSLPAGVFFVKILDENGRVFSVRFAKK